MKVTSPISAIQKDFPILERTIGENRLVYLDSAASTLKPRPVVEAVSQHYLMGASNVHRGAHTLSAEATEAYESARATVREFIQAKSNREIVFTRGTTESINLVASSYLAPRLKPGDEIITTLMEHHANFVPWQQLCKKTGAVLRLIPVSEDGSLDLNLAAGLFNKKTKLLAFNWVSNALGTINPVEKLIQVAREHQVPVLVDAAQSIAHINTHVQELDVDFLAFSGHKLYGPTGIGVLYAKEALLDAMEPYQVGGDMIETVRVEESTWNGLPYKFEAGTPHIAGAIGLAAAMRYIKTIGWQAIQEHESQLLTYTREKLSAIPKVKIIGDSEEKIAIFSMHIDGVHPSDLASLLDQQGIAIRTGFHCTEPLWQHFKMDGGSARASFAIYNSSEDADALAKALEKSLDILL